MRTTMHLTPTSPLLMRSGGCHSDPAVALRCAALRCSPLFRAALRLLAAVCLHGAASPPPPLPSIRFPPRRCLCIAGRCSRRMWERALTRRARGWQEARATGATLASSTLMVRAAAAAAAGGKGSPRPAGKRQSALPAGRQTCRRRPRLRVRPELSALALCRPFVLCRHWFGRVCCLLGHARCQGGGHHMGHSLRRAGE